MELFREHGGAGLLVPKQYHGGGASALDAVRTIMAIGSYAPGLAVGTAMHHFSVATLFVVVDRSGPDALETILLQEIAEKRLLVASAVAEGIVGRSILQPTVVAIRSEDGYIVNGSKKPCSLARSMDLLTATAAITESDGSTRLGFIFAPADLPGISVHPHWATPILAAAESDEVRFTDVKVPEDFVVCPELDDPSGLDSLQAVGFIWFELLISAAYLGVAASLVDRAFARGKGTADLVVPLQAAISLIEGTARTIMAGELDNAALGEAVLARYGAQAAITEVAGRAVQLMGGTAFIDSPDLAYLLAAAQPLAFHPPSRHSAEPSLISYYQGSAFTIA
jgi:alkylation response protein AidB-like acyl-CoA dehydrogenase